MEQTKARRGSLNAGFTLIELMVVTAIIGIISQRAMVQVMPALYKGKRAGLTLYLSGNLRLALTLHATDKGRYPAVADLPASGDVTGYLVSHDFLDRDIIHLAKELKEALATTYSSDGKSYKYSACFTGPGAAYLEKPCVRMTEGSLEYAEAP